MSPACKIVKEANRKLGVLLEAMQKSEMGERHITPEQLTAALAEVVRVGEWMGARTMAESDSDLQHELDTYCHHLHQMREIMPHVRARLLTERARLESERAHLEAAAAWANGARKTS